MINDKVLYKQISKTFEKLQDLKADYNKAKALDPRRAKAIAAKVDNMQKRFNLLNKKYDAIRKYDAYRQKMKLMMAKLDKQQDQLHKELVKVSKQLPKTKDAASRIQIRNKINSLKNQINDITTQKENILDKIRIADKKVSDFIDKIDSILKTLGHKV